MSRISIAACVCAVAIVFSGSVSAEEGSTEEQRPGWTGEVEAFASISSGNTENAHFGFKGKLRRQIGRYIHVVSGNSDFAQQTIVVDDQETDQTTQDRWMLAYQVDAQIRDQTHGYVRAQYDEDRFSGFNKRWFVGAGVGQDLIDAEAVTWSVEGGPGYRWAELEEDPVMMARHRTHEFAAYADSDLDVQLRENVSIEQNANVTYAQSNTTYDTIIGLRTKLTETISSKLSYQVKYETDPPVGRESRDTMLKASLLLGF